MSLFDLLSEKTDARKGGNDCLFNGYLEDYLDMVTEEDVRTVLQSLYDADHSLKVIRGLHLPVEKKSVSNTIIRYKDIYKLGDHAVIVPYIVYGKNGNDGKAVLICKEDYIYAKATYYAFTDPGTAYAAYKNDCIAVCLSDDAAAAYRAMQKFHAGKVQRDLDHRHFKSYDEAFERCRELSSAIAGKTIDPSADRETFVNCCVSQWYLLKKFVYVQYMVDKKILSDRHAGDIHMQRNKAKENADNIRFISLSELWKNLPKVEKTQSDSAE